MQDLLMLEEDQGFCAVLQQVEEHGLTRRAWSALARRWRRGRQRNTNHSTTC